MDSLNIIDNETLQKHIKRFFWGILIYSIASHILFEINLKHLSGVIINIIQLCGLAMWGFSMLKLVSWRNVSNRYLLVTVTALLLWEVFIMFHGFIFNYPYLKEHLFSDYRSMSYLVPLAVFVMVNNPVFLQKTCKYSYRLGIAFLIAFPFFSTLLLEEQTIAEQFVWIFATGGSGFILLTSFYHSRRKVIVSTIVMVLALIFITIMARRSIMLLCSYFLLFSFLIIPIVNKNNSWLKKWIFIFSFLIITFAGYNIFLSNKYGTFYKITKRATEDTREIVFLSFLMDMSNTDFIIGKGCNGTYFCPGVDKDFNGGEELKYRDLDYRTHIECGYMQLILNGGIIYLAIYLLIMFPAIFKGLFFSRNIFSKACALLILIHLLDMVPFGLPTFSWRQFLLWFAVAICYSKEFRLKEDEEIYEILSIEKDTNEDNTIN
ncbi:MAG: hypothetical protein LBH32_00700 [Dysgonamonadaceae bacterium]|jgi:hypothetical protein|nr:hypothetical protein [Dysgonamonadaceae bacterium]